MFDMLIKNARILDGLGSKDFHSDLGIIGDTVSAIGDLKKAEAKHIINAEGFYASPGFIDIHTHSELLYLINRKAESAVHQGVTTEVVGNCGISAAPLEGDAKREIESMAKMMGIELNWKTFSEYEDLLLKEGVAINFVQLVGHGNVRDAAIGRTDRDPTEEEINKMKDELNRAFELGVFGLSSGLIYPPGTYTKTHELIELSRSVSKNGGYYASHIRGEGETLLKAISEAIEIGRCSKTPVQISHIKVSGLKYRDFGPRALELIDNALDEGIDIAADMYPYIAGHTSLQSILPYWVHNQGNEVLIRRLKDTATRENIKKEMQERGGEFSLDNITDGWNGIIIGLAMGHPEYQGRSIWQVSEELKKDPVDAIFDIIIECNCIVFVNIMSQSEDNVCLFIQHPKVMIASDSYTTAPYGLLGMMRPHPRTYGTFPRVLCEYVRRKKIISLREAIRKMTSLPASRLGLKNRGVIGEGKKADIVIFDAETIEDRATYEEPNRYPEGVKTVIVNGKIVVQDNENKGALPGMALKK